MSTDTAEKPNPTRPRTPAQIISGYAACLIVLFLIGFLTALITALT